MKYSDFFDEYSEYWINKVDLEQWIEKIYFCVFLLFKKYMRRILVCPGTISFCSGLNTIGLCISWSNVPSLVNFISS